MKTLVHPRLLRLRRGTHISVLLVIVVAAGCQSPNVFTAKNDSSSSNSVEPVSATSGPAGLPAPTNSGTPSSAQSSTTVSEHLRMGESELEQGNYAQAQIHFHHVLQQHPDHVKANHRLGVLADNLGQYPKAEHHYRKALEGDPRNAALLSDLGYSYFLQGRYADSERYLLEARRFDPNYHKAIANLGVLYASTKRDEEALAMFAHIGDDAEVRQIMKQIADGRFPSPQQSQNQFTPRQQTTVVTTQTTAQHAAPATPQSMNEATRDFVEQMRLAREELRRAEEQLARQRAQSNAVPTQNPVAPVGGQESPAWARHAAASHVAEQPATQYAGVDPFAGQQAASVVQRGPHPADQVAAVDRRDQSSPPPGPIVVGPQGPSSNQSQVERQATSQMPSIQGGPPYGEPVSLRTPQSDRLPVQQQADATGATAPQYWPPPASQRSVAQPSHVRNGQPLPAENTFAHDAATAGDDARRSAWGQQFDASLRQSTGTQETTAAIEGLGSPQTVQQLSASDYRSARRPVEHAYHTQQPGRHAGVSLAGGSTTSPTSHQIPSWNSQQGSQSQQASALGQSGAERGTGAPDPYEQARREAALMGLGAGPGQVFPYIQQTPRSMPGTDSRLNGTQYPAPARHMPTGLVPPGLNHHTPANLSPQGNELGQRMPNVPVQTTVPAGATTRNAAYQAYQQNARDFSRSPAPTTYQDTRVQQAAQLNGMINQTWGQSPQSPPYGVTQQSPTYRQLSPTTDVPPQTAGRPMQASRSSLQDQSPMPEPWNPVVVPGASPSSPPIGVHGAQPGRQANPNQPPLPQGYSGPVIVPSSR